MEGRGIDSRSRKVLRDALSSKKKLEEVARKDKDLFYLLHHIRGEPQENSKASRGGFAKRYSPDWGEQLA